MNFIKKFALAIVLFFLCAGISAQKIAFLDCDSLLYSLPEYKQALAKCETKRLQADSFMRAMADKFTNHVTDCFPPKRSKEEEERWKKAEEERLVDMQKEIEEARSRLQKQLNGYADSLMNPIVKKVKAAIKETAKKQGYSYVLDKKELLYSDEADDIFLQVRQKLKGRTMEGK